MNLNEIDFFKECLSNTTSLIFSFRQRLKETKTTANDLKFIKYVDEAIELINEFRYSFFGKRSFNKKDLDSKIQEIEYKLHCIRLNCNSCLDGE